MLRSKIYENFTVHGTLNITDNDYIIYAKFLSVFLKFCKSIGKLELLIILKI